MRWLTLLLMFACVVSGVWAFAWGFPLANRFIVLANEAGYTRASFTVDRVRYVIDAEYPPTWWAEGRVEGDGFVAMGERYDLLSVVREVSGQRELERLVPEGTSFDVYYNDAMPTSLMQGETLRVLAYTPTRWDDERRLRDRILLTGMGPFVLSVVLLVGVRVLARATRPAEDRYGSFHPETG
ncbi:MAG: hypothetical protein AAGH64_12425 [Planctomycetota bacterium]